MGKVGAAAHQTGDQDDLAAGSLLVYAAGSALVTGQVARTVGTESAGIVGRRIEYSIAVHYLEVPVSERRDLGLRERAHRLVPFILLFNDSSDVDLDVLHVLNCKAALGLYHRVIGLLSCDMRTFLRRNKIKHFRRGLNYKNL
ncbi:MAG: hypothetical protein A4E45_01802 [Methanosaeta sp. PtaB.Bin039]|nr:MAG: hypothetical protein A4E45_01802 [Methanosaeta sp. PtaB.Bin039]